MKKRMKKRMIAFILAMTFVVSSIAGCGKANGNQDEKGDPDGVESGKDEKQDTKDLALEEYTEPISYSFWTQGGANCNDIGSTYFGQYIKEEFNIDVSENFLGGSVENYTDKINMGIASRELPDVIMTWGDKDLINQMAEEGLILQLDEFVEKYLGDYVDTYASETVMNSWRSEDGNLYCVPSLTLPETEKLAEGKVGIAPVSGIGVREDIFKELDLDIPTNTEELYDVLIQIRDANLTVNGEKVYPLGIVGFNTSSGNVNLDYFEKMFGAKCYANDLYFDEENNLRLSNYDMPQYDEVLQYAAKLYREGVLSPEVFSETSDETKQKAGDGRYAVVMCNPYDVDSVNINLKNVDENWAFVPIAPVYAEGVTAESSPYHYANPYGSLCIVVNADVEDPDRLFKFLAWLTTDYGFMVSEYGPAGEHDGYTLWDVEEDGTMVMCSDFAADKQAEMWAGDCWFANVLGGYVLMPLLCSNSLSFLKGYDPAADDVFSSHAVYGEELEPNYSECIGVDLIGNGLAKVIAGDVEKAKGTSVSKVLNEGIAKILLEAKSDEEVLAMWTEVLANADKAGRKEVQQEEYELQYDTYLELTGAK